MRFVSLFSCILFLAACAEPDSSSSDTVAADEAPFFVADRHATGPLTLAELQIDIPDEIDRALTDNDRSCFFEAVERRALAAGDPALLDPNDFVYWDGEVDRAEWSQHSNYMQRVLLAQAIVSWAMIDC